jgi:hypothetical protein
MSDNDDLIEQAKHNAFGDLAHRSKPRVVGSGISETTKISLDVREDPSRINQMPAPWTENRAMIVQLFEDILQRSRTCPGRDHLQCCGATVDQSCFPSWQEREDPEWYAMEISKYLGLVDWRLGEVTSITAALAADEAFELGCLFTEALIKFRWDRHAKSGEKSAVGSKVGGDNRRNAIRRQLGAQGTVDAVDELLQQGKKLGLAYKLVGKQQGVSGQTIGKEYRKAKKLR